MLIFSRVLGFCKKSKLSRGFTLIELAAVFIILSLIARIVLSGQVSFESTTAMRSLAYSVALSVRQAQVYGISIREAVAGSNTFAPGYGIYFPDSAADPLKNGVDPDRPVQYMLFADTNNDGMRASDGSEDIKTYSLGQNYTFGDLCVVGTGGTLCASNGDFTTMWVMFRRPNPDACIATDVQPSACVPMSIPMYGSAKVRVAHSSGNSRGITILTTGAISLDVAHAP